MHLGSACRIFALDENRVTAGANRDSVDSNLDSVDANMDSAVANKDSVDANLFSDDASRDFADTNLFSADVNPTIADVGEKFLLQMRRSKRRGAFEHAYRGFEAAARVLWMSHDPSM